jgi:hypothetical protein
MHVDTTVYLQASPPRDCPLRVRNLVLLECRSAFPTYPIQLRELEEACTAAAQIALQRHRETLQADMEARLQDARLATTVAEEQALAEETSRCEAEMHA